MQMLAKLLYSLLLLGLSGVLLRELWTVWFDSRVFVGKFDVVSEAGKDESSGAAFAKRIVGAQAILAQQLTDYQTRRTADSPTDKTFVIEGMTPVGLPPAALGGMEITIQSVNVSQILTKLRNSIVSPNEVGGSVTARESSVLAAVDWPGAPKLKNSQTSLSKFLVPSQANEQAAAAYIASSISWARAASIDSALAEYPRAQFSDFSVALGDLYALADGASSPTGLGATDVALVRKRAAQLRLHYGQDHVYPEIYRLRADLLDLLPEVERKLAELVESQEDRLRYAMLSPKLRGLPEEERRFAALALARPAIAVEYGTVLKPPENWSNLLRRREAEISSITKSVGLIMNVDGKPAGTGFVVAPNTMLTAAFVVDSARRGVGHGTAPPQQKQNERVIRLCMGRNSVKCDESLDIGREIYRGESDGSKVVLVELPNHDATLYPPAPLAETLSPANTLIGQYAFVVGYPFLDARMPIQFMMHLLGKEDGIKRVMPGRILALGERGLKEISLKEGRPPGQLTFTSDISTSSGTSGSPFVELATGKVIGMSFAGEWKGERGKFAYAEALPKAALEIVARRLADGPDLQKANPKDIQR